MTIQNQVYIDLRKGSIQAFQVVFDAYSANIYNLSFHILKNKEQAEEVVQETFLKVWMHREELDDAKDLWPYIYVIAKRICYNQLRSMKYDLLAQQELIKNMTVLAEDSAHQLSEINKILQESVDLLPERQKLVWIMSREEGKSHKEIADELGISPNTVKNTIVQTLKTLRHTFKKADYLYFFIFLFFL
ncbi:RNA polymerase sigma factor [Sphingobacterium sp. CZ-2]|uniref:RNA polymerase sigma factor n=1 Tax=Sphingobacterium sp. CZ-2 TaxID=2557994 RepID=UPI00106FEB6B|nr:RNA polymerase sigma-70 factor [Sphingobacterium sp. CZ-2]QBR13277.1 RNA polymerase sigma-70 factor [Sphingobacterium sp. CZ-2]